MTLCCDLGSVHVVFSRAFLLAGRGLPLNAQLVPRLYRSHPDYAGALPAHRTAARIITYGTLHSLTVSSRDALTASSCYTRPPRPDFTG